VPTIKIQGTVHNWGICSSFFDGRFCGEKERNYGHIFRLGIYYFSLSIKLKVRNLLEADYVKYSTSTGLGVLPTAEQIDANNILYVALLFIIDGWRMMTM